MASGPEGHLKVEGGGLELVAAEEIGRSAEGVEGTGELGQRGVGGLVVGGAPEDRGSLARFRGEFKDPADHGALARAIDSHDRYA